MWRTGLSGGVPARNAGRATRAQPGRRESAPAALVAVVLVAVTVLSCTGCAGSPATGAASAAASPAATPRAGGTFDYPLRFDVNSLLPFEVVESPEVAHQIFEGLVAYEAGADGRLATVPCLAESWEANADATVWTFHLRRGVRFQEPVGRELTAADVVADFRYTALDSNDALPAYMNAAIRGTDDDGHVSVAHQDRLGVRALDRYTVRFTLKRSFATFPDTLGGAFGWVWPVDYLRRVGREGFQEQPVGTGPFVVSRRVVGKYIDLRRNPGWWNAASGQPYLEAVHFEVFKSVTAELRAFQEGLLDYTFVPQGQVEASRSLPRVASGEWTPLVLPVEATGYACFNMTAPAARGAAGLTLRRAVDAAIDREALARAVSDGVYVPQTGVVPPCFAGWEAEQPPQPYDPAAARALYEQAGSPSLTLTVGQDRLGDAVAAYMQEACRAAGIDLRVRTIPWESLVARIGEGRAPAFFLMGWAGDYPSYDNFLYEPYLSALSPYTLGTCYSDPEVDRLLTLARSTADPAQHLDLSRRAAHEVEGDKPVLPLFEYAEYRLLDSRIGGFTVSPLYGLDAWKLWVK